MKLLTHNMLTSNIVKGVTQGYPLKVIPSKVEVKETDFNPQFVTHILPKIDYSALLKAANEVGHAESLPPEVVPNFKDDEDFLKKMHHILLEVVVLEGFLECPQSGHKFPISNGIPNMQLGEDQ